jgi:subtilisin family serine protease
MAAVTGLRRSRGKGQLLVVMLLLAMALGSIATPAPVEATPAEKRYVVVLAGELTADGFALAGSREAALALVIGAGGEVLRDLTRQIGVLVVTSANPLFAEALRASPLVEEAAEDFKWKAFPSYEEAVASGALTVVDPASLEAGGGGGPEETEDPLEPLQWSMQLIRAPEAHAIQAGSRLVQVGILDSGIDGRHPDFIVDQGGTNVHCSAPEAATFVPAGPGLGNPDPCTDNQVHGTHVAGIVAAQANGLGVVGVAPNVTLVPVKVCDTVGFCYSSATTAGITHAGDMKFEVINMSFFVDDNTFLSSTQFKCMSDPVQRAFRQANERASRYARNQGVVPVASLGNAPSPMRTTATSYRPRPRA